MKKKVKKIPKYSVGTSMVDIIKANNRLNIQLPEFTPVNVQGISSGTAGTIAAGKTWDTMNSTQRTGAVVDAIGTGINTAVSSIGEPVTFAGVANGALSGAQAGAAIGGPLGAVFGAVGGTALASIGNTASTNGYGNYKKSTGITRLLGIGKSDDEIIRQANREKNSVIANAQTQNLRMKYENEVPTGSINVLAAEGGIMRQPVDALVSKGELIYNPVTKKLSKVPGSKGKPNKKDDVYTRLYEGDVVISNSPTMLMANGKTPAQNLEGLVDSNKNQKAKEAIIKKVVNWQEANKTKTKELPKYEGGTPYVQLGKDPIKESEKKLFKLVKKSVLKDKDNTDDNSRWAAYAQLGLSALQVLNNEKPEADKPNEVKFSVPTYDYAPTGVDVTKELREIDDSYALSRYNFGNVYSNTGAGMAAGLQAAATRAKQRADVRQYQTNEQNKLIGQNIGLYNNWQTMNSNIMNQVYDKIDANNAAARNINRENMKAFSKNIGMYGRDLAGWDNNLLQIMALQGLGDYGYSNWNDMLKQLKKFT